MLRMKSRESIANYFSWTMTIINKMRIHGDKIEDVTIIEKILRSMTPKFNIIVCSIEESKHIDALSIDELQGSLLVNEQKNNQQEKKEQALKALTNKKKQAFKASNHSPAPYKRQDGGRANKNS